MVEFDAIEEILCPRCGGSMDWDDCWNGCDDGWTHPGELFDADPLWYDEDEVQRCHICDGAGGWYRCWGQACRERAAGEPALAAEVS